MCPRARPAARRPDTRKAALSNSLVVASMRTATFSCSDGFGPFLWPYTSPSGTGSMGSLIRVSTRRRHLIASSLRFLLRRERRAQPLDCVAVLDDIANAGRRQRPFRLIVGSDVAGSRFSAARRRSNQRIPAPGKSVHRKKADKTTIGWSSIPGSPGS